MNYLSAIGEGFRFVIDDTANNTATLNKACDLIVSLATIVSKVSGVVPKPLENIAHGAKWFSGFYKGFYNLPDRAYDFINDYSKWNDAKKASTIFLTVAQSFAFAEFISNTLEVASFVAPLKLWKEIVYLPASACGLASSVIELKKAEKEAGNSLSLMNDRERHVANWTEFFAIWNLSDVEKAKAVREKIKSTENEEQRFWQEVLDTNLAKFAFDEKVTWVNPIKNDEGVANGIDVTNPIDDWEKRDWDQYQSDVKRKASQKRWKEALGIAENVGKLALGVIGLVGLYLGLNTVAAFSFGLVIAWTAVQLVGYTKQILGDWFKEHTVRVQDPLQFPPPMPRAARAA